MFSRLLASSLPLVPRPIVHRVAKRYVAGVTRDEALLTVEALRAASCSATVALLGEHVADVEEASAAVDEYKALQHTLADHGIEPSISVKPTHLGLLFDPAVCRENLAALVRAAHDVGGFVRIDMEDHTSTDATLELYRDLRRDYENVGVVLQAYLRRTPDDVAKLPAKANVRLCKGIYVEPPEISFVGLEDIRTGFLLTLDKLLKAGAYVGIATHDEPLVRRSLDRVRQQGLEVDDYELQMLLGVTPRLRSDLVAEGNRLRVYVPYGPDWYNYSLRRLRENPRIAMHVARALFGRG